MYLIDCKSVREQILDEVRSTGYKDLKLVIISTSDDPASEVYIKNKIKTAESVGIEAEVITLKSASFESLKAKLYSLAQDPSVTGVILQLPLAEHLKPYERELLDLIPYEKDVDGLSSDSMGRLWAGKPCIVPATAAGVMRLLPEDLNGKKVTIVNRSDLIGKPLIKLLLDRNATVSVCHSKTSIGETMRRMSDANIVITGIGVPRYFGDAFFSPHGKQIIIDCGVNRDSNGKLCGNVDTNDIGDLDVSITPVPGGVGLLTTAQLMYNVAKAYELQEGLTHAESEI